jgi:hypothetical protein
MSSLTIPVRYFNGFAKLFSLSDELTESIITSLQKADLIINPEKIIRESVATSTGFNPEDVKSVSDTIMSLFILHADSYKPLEEMLDELILSLKESNFEGLSFPEEKYNAIKNYLLKLLSIDNLFLSAKAVNIKFEQEILFAKANVISEILPVFSPNAEEIPKAAMIVHQLGIHYYQDGNHKDFYVRVDLDEIDDLIQILERAKKKAASLQSFLESSNLTYIENK